MQQTRVAVALVTTAAAKCDMRSVVIIIELSYRYRDLLLVMDDFKISKLDRFRFDFLKKI